VLAKTKVKTYNKYIVCQYKTEDTENNETYYHTKICPDYGQRCHLVESKDTLHDKWVPDSIHCDANKLSISSSTEPCKNTDVLKKVENYYGLRANYQFTVYT